MVATPNPRKVLGVYPPGPQHWVGDGFRVLTVFWPQRGAAALSPFLLLDYAQPHHFAPSTRRLGVGEHPHRGFETVTLALHGEIEHRDSAGGGGCIGPGDVQWMTAGSGVVHEELHSRRFAEAGGLFSMLQLWVNLPSSQKMRAPRYQALVDASFPRVDLGPAVGRLIAGTLHEQMGPAQTCSPLLVMDLVWSAAGAVELSLPAGWTTLVVLVSDAGGLGAESIPLQIGHLGLFDPDEVGPVQLHGTKATRMLILAGEPLDEPVVAHGPFVMNEWDEIRTAISDYESGAMGRLSPTQD